MNSTAGFFDFSIIKKGQIKYLNTGKKLYYLGYKDFIKILNKNKNKFFYFRKIQYKKKDLFWMYVWRKKCFETFWGNEDYTSSKKKIKHI